MWGLSLAHEARRGRSYSRQTGDICLQTGGDGSEGRVHLRENCQGCELEGRGPWSSEGWPRAGKETAVRAALHAHRLLCSLAVGLRTSPDLSGLRFFLVEWRVLSCPVVGLALVWGGAQSSCCCWGLLEELLAGRLSHAATPTPRGRLDLDSGRRDLDQSCLGLGGGAERGGQGLRWPGPGVPEEAEGRDEGYSRGLWGLEAGLMGAARLASSAHDWQGQAETNPQRTRERR